MNGSANFDDAYLILGRSDTLPWDESKENSRRFLKITSASLAGSLTLLLLINFVFSYPVQERSAAEKIPTRIARVILEEKQEIMAVAVAIVEVQAISEILEVIEPEPELVLEEIIEPVVLESTGTEIVEALQRDVLEPTVLDDPNSATAQASDIEISVARKKASNTGVLALSSQLSSLALLAPKASTATSTGTKQQLRTASAAASNGSAGESILADASAGSGGITATEVSAPEIQELKAKDVTVVEVQADIQQAAISGEIRTAEEITLIFDQNKAAFYALYKRALRKTLGLKGRIVFNLTVASSGAVIDCTIVLTELNEPDLEKRLISRIKLINFGPKNVDNWNFDYHIDFAPGG